MCSPDPFSTPFPFRHNISPVVNTAPAAGLIRNRPIRLPWGSPALQCWGSSHETVRKTSCPPGITARITCRRGLKARGGAKQAAFWRSGAFVGSTFLRSGRAPTAISSTPDACEDASPQLSEECPPGLGKPHHKEIYWFGNGGCVLREEPKCCVHQALGY